jgi:hypothetical protein
MTDAPDFQLTVLLNFTPGPLMPGPDAPDWEVTAQLVNSPQNDAPDWQKYIVGPGGVPIKPGPPHVLPAIIQEASGTTHQDLAVPTITVTLPSAPTPGNQLVAFLCQVLPVITDVELVPDGGVAFPPGPIAGWTCIGSQFGANTITLRVHSCLALVHEVVTGDGKTWVFPVQATGIVYLAGCAVYEVTPSGTISATGYSSLGGALAPLGKIGALGAYGTSDALGSLGIGCAYTEGPLDTANNATLDAGALPAGAWSADIDLYDPTSTYYNNVDTFTAPFIPPADNTFLYVDYSAVNAQNAQSAILSLLFPPP